MGLRWSLSFIDIIGELPRNSKAAVAGAVKVLPGALYIDNMVDNNVESSAAR